MRGQLLIVDAHELTAAGLQLALTERDWDVAAISKPSPDDMLELVHQFEPQCVLLDIYLGAGAGNGIELIGPVKATGTQVVMFTAEQRRLVLAACVEAGASGWISRDATLDELDSTLAAVIDGRPMLGCATRTAMIDELHAARNAAQRAQCVFDQLSQREALVLAALIDGLSAEEIACSHFVSLTTVRSQIRNVLHKLGVRSQVAAIAVATPHKDLLPHPEGYVQERRRSSPHSAPTGPAFRRDQPARQVG